jgi:predicted GNAT family N-acyltransferase
MQLTICRVTTDEEIFEIKALQTANLPQNLSTEEQEKEGFVTAVYSIEFLQRMNRLCPSIIAKSESGHVVGYALVLTKELEGEHALLSEFFAMLKTIPCPVSIKQISSPEASPQTLFDTNFVMVGQLCVAKEYRGQGLVDKMYNFYRSCLSSEYECQEENFLSLSSQQYDLCLTDVAQNNPRSITAHLRCGFEIVHSIEYAQIMWHIVVWQWKKNNLS